MPSLAVQQHILAINNAADVLALFTDLLEEEGYRVSTQLYTERDLPKIVAQDPDLIILDDMWATEDDGWTLLQMLRMNRATAEVPIVLCTGAVTHVRETEGHLEAMGVAVVFKPFHIDDLLETIHRVLGDAETTSSWTARVSADRTKTTGARDALGTGRDITWEAAAGHQREDQPSASRSTPSDASTSSSTRLWRTSGPSKPMPRSN